MKIAVFLDGFYPHIDGVVTSTVALILELQKNGHDVLLFAPNCKESEKPKKLPYKVVWVPSVPAFVYPDVYLGLFSPKVIKEFSDFNPDVVHITVPAPMGFLGIGLAKMKKKALVGVFHGYFMEPEYLQIFGIKRGTKTIGNLLWNYARSVYDRCDLNISPSQFVKEDMQRHQFSRPILVCNNGISIDLQKTDKKKQSALSKKYGLNDHKVVLYVGRLSKEKAVDKLINVFALVKKEVRKSKLLIVGDGPVKQDLEEQARKLGLAESVVFTGSILHEDLMRNGIYKLAHVFVSCSTSEVQPMTFIEASHFGLPLVVSKARGNSELIDQNGYLVEVGSDENFTKKIITVLTNEKKRKKMIDSAFNLAKKYSIESVADSYIKAYQRAIELKKS